MPSLRCSSVMLVLWLVLVSSWSATTTQAGDLPSIPILARLSKDPTTTLYTITIKHGGLPLVVDLSGPLYWSRCPPAHRTIPCHSNVCQTLNQNLPPGTCTFTDAHLKCTTPNEPCPTYPLNPITGQCAITDATTFTLSGNATDGKNPLFPVTFRVLGACSTELLFTDSLPANSWGVVQSGKSALHGMCHAACDRRMLLLGSAPAGLNRRWASSVKSVFTSDDGLSEGSSAWHMPCMVLLTFRGVVGMSRLPQSLPTQIASTFQVPKQFALCLPRSGGTGAAIFGGGPFHLMAGPASVDLAQDLRQNQIPFLKYFKNGGYYLRVNGINVNNEPVAFPTGALDLDAGSGEGGVMLSTTLTQKDAGEVATYTTLRSDIYRALFNAFDAATSGISRAPAVHPFEMCYQASAFGSTRLGYAVANIELLLDNGRTWLIPGGSSLVQVNDNTVCFAFLEMTTVSRVPGSPAVLFGGYQFEDHLLLFDLDKETFSFSGPLAGIRTSCSNFNFTMTPVS